jgi:hypothetical protein
MLFGDTPHKGRRGVRSADFLFFLRRRRRCRDWRFACGWRSLCFRRRRFRFGCDPAFSDHRDYGIDLDRLPFGEKNLAKRAGSRGGNDGVDLIRRDFEEILVAINLVARLFQPPRDGSLKDAFPHLGHDDLRVCHWIFPCQ